LLRYAAAAVTSLVLITGLSACGAGDPPAAQPKPTRTATTPSASPSPTPPAMPAAARANTKAGAKAYVRHYIRALNYATFTGDTKELRTLGQPRCGSCQNVLRGIRAIYRNGGHVVGGAFQITHLDAVPHPDDRGFTVDAFARFSAQTIYRPGASPRRYRRGSNIFSFILGFRGGWYVSDWSRSS
jgi:hypothetical protein